MSHDWTDEPKTPKDIAPKGSTPPPSKGHDDKGGHGKTGPKH